MLQSCEDDGFCHQTAWLNGEVIGRGAIHTGQLACSALRHRIQPDGVPGDARLQAAVLGTTAGSLGSLAPLWDALPGEALLALQKAMVLAAPHPAGLNPTSFRWA